MLKRYSFKNYDFLLIILTISLSIIGVLAISSADESLRNKQLLGIVLGVVLMVFISLLDYTQLLRFYWFYYILNLVLLVLVIINGNSTNGSQRWLRLFGITFQPSEIAKILLILFYAQFIMKYKNKIKNLKFIFLCLLLLLPPLVLILKQPDLSTSIMVLVIFCMVMFVGGISPKLVAGVLTVAIPSAALIFYSAVQPDSPFLHDYQQKRILAWLHPEDYANSEAYQTLNSIMAIGSGQLQGKGYNTNEISSVLNGGFISESQTDFIFSVVGEEFGFIGSCLVILLVLAIAFECLRIARKAKDVLGTIIATGMACWIGFQGFMNIGVATGVLPNTGIPLPLVSSGLTSLVSVYIGIGFVLNVRLQSRKY